MEELEQDWNRRRWFLMSKAYSGLTPREREELESLQARFEETMTKNRQESQTQFRTTTLRD